MADQFTQRVNTWGVVHFADNLLRIVLRQNEPRHIFFLIDPYKVWIQEFRSWYRVCKLFPIGRKTTAQISNLSTKNGFLPQLRYSWDRKIGLTQLAKTRPDRFQKFGILRKTPMFFREFYRNSTDSKPVRSQLRNF